MKRMTDERLAGFTPMDEREGYNVSDLAWNMCEEGNPLDAGLISELVNEHTELLQALKAERKWAKACIQSGSEQCYLRDKRITELQADMEELEAQNASLEKLTFRTESQLEAAQKEIDDFQHSFNIRWDADMRAIKRWQQATGNELTWPDHADMVVWLLEQLEAVKKIAHKGIKANRNGWLQDIVTMLEKTNE